MTSLYFLHNPSGVSKKIEILTEPTNYVEINIFQNLTQVKV